MTVRVFAEAGALFVGNYTPIPLGSATVAAVGDDLQISTLSGDLLCSVRFGRLRDKDGNSFSTLTAALAYVTSEISEPLPTSDPGNFVNIVESLLHQGI